MEAVFEREAQNLLAIFERKDGPAVFAAAERAVSALFLQGQSHRLTDENYLVVDPKILVGVTQIQRAGLAMLKLKECLLEIPEGCSISSPRWWTQILKLLLQKVLIAKPYQVVGGELIVEGSTWISIPGSQTEFVELYAVRAYSLLLHRLLLAYVETRKPPISLPAAEVSMGINTISSSPGNSKNQQPNANKGTEQNHAQAALKRNPLSEVLGVDEKIPDRDPQTKEPIGRSSEDRHQFSVAADSMVLRDDKPDRQAPSVGNPDDNREVCQSFIIPMDRGARHLWMLAEKHIWAASPRCALLQRDDLFTRLTQEIHQFATIHLQVKDSTEFIGICLVKATKEEIRYEKTIKTTQGNSNSTEETNIALMRLLNHVFEELGGASKSAQTDYNIKLTEKAFESYLNWLHDILDSKFASNQSGKSLPNESSLQFQSLSMGKAFQAEDSISVVHPAQDQGLPAASKQQTPAAQHPQVSAQKTTSKPEKTNRPKSPAPKPQAPQPTQPNPMPTPLNFTKPKSTLAPDPIVMAASKDDQKTPKPQPTSTRPPAPATVSKPTHPATRTNKQPDSPVLVLQASKSGSSGTGKSDEDSQGTLVRISSLQLPTNAPKLTPVPGDLKSYLKCELLATNPYFSVVELKDDANKTEMLRNVKEKFKATDIWELRGFELNQHDRTFQADSLAILNDALWDALERRISVHFDFRFTKPGANGEDQHARKLCIECFTKPKSTLTGAAYSDIVLWRATISLKNSECRGHGYGEPVLTPIVMSMSKLVALLISFRLWRKELFITEIKPCLRLQ